MSTQPSIGSVGWIDLTVTDAEALRKFYEAVVGWSSTEVAMGGYSDYCMYPPGADKPVAGICHARGENADLPAQWLIYITVYDLDASIAECKALGGKVLAGPKEMGSQGRFCVIQDPAGALAALFEP